MIQKETRQSCFALGNNSLIFKWFAGVQGALVRFSINPAFYGRHSMVADEDVSFFRWCQALQLDSVVKQISLLCLCQLKMKSK